MFIPQLGKYAETILENGSSSGRKLAKLQAIGRQAVAALCALGGFKETIKIGSEVQVVGKGVLGSVGIVMSINEQEGIATVKFPSCEYRRACKASDILTVPISRLSTPRSEVSEFPLLIKPSLKLVSQLCLCFSSLHLIRHFRCISSPSQKNWYKPCSPCFCHRRAVCPFTRHCQLQETAPALSWLQYACWPRSEPGPVW